MTQPLITSRTDWSPALLEEIWGHIDEIGKNDLGLTYRPNQFEIVSAEGMLDAYSSTGMPLMYHHWSFGKDFLKNWNKYQKGKMGLALEMVINSAPYTINYLMEDNDAVAQAMVMAHAGVGHNAVFTNNYLFAENTNPGGIVDYLIFARDFIKDCEDKYGIDEVELLLDAAHSLATHAIDKRKRKHKKVLKEEELQAKALKEADEKQLELDIIIKTTSVIKEEPKVDEDDLDNVEDEENLVYFIYKNAPNMEKWQREILRIVYKINSYFYAQGQSKTVNEGMATYTHFYIMNELEKKGLISPDAMISFLQSHSGVIFQPDMSSKYYDGRFNPYALGFDILKEVRRICDEPTAEDKEWFPELVGKDWRTEIKSAAFDYNDESFIEQFLSPNLMRKYKMMTVDYKKDKGIVTEISDELGYRNMRRTLAQEYNRINYIPDLCVAKAKMRGDRTLVLEYRPYRGRSLHKANAEKTLQYLKLLWGYPCEIIQVDDGGQQVLKFKA